MIERSEAAFDAVSVITIGIEPKDDRSADVEELAGDDDFVTAASGVSSWRLGLWSGSATDEKERAGEEK